MSSSAAEFVEGGVQESCEDACSICLEAFCAEDPATVTNCNHAYHIQCILEWVQRSSDCPMCWQPLTMKDVVGQELLTSAEHERSLRSSQIQVPFYPQYRSEDYELDSFSSFEERLMQHLTARQVRGNWRRDRFHFRPTLSEHPGQYLYFPSNAAHSPDSFGPVVDTSEVGGLEEEELGNANGATRSAGHTPVSRTLTSRPVNAVQGASTSGSHSFSEAIKARISAASSKYKGSFAKTARLFKEKMRARKVANSDSGVRSRDVSKGVTKAFGQISLESAAQVRESNDPVKQACISDKKQFDVNSVVSTNSINSSVDTGMCKYESHCQDSSHLLASAGSAGCSDEMLSGTQSLVKDKQSVAIP